MQYVMAEQSAWGNNVEDKEQNYSLNSWIDVSRLLTSLCNFLMSVKQVMFPSASQHKKRMPKLEDQTQHQANFHVGKNISGFSSSEKFRNRTESCLPIVSQQSMQIQQHMNHQSQTLAAKEIKSNQNTKRKDVIFSLQWSKLQLHTLENDHAFDGCLSHMFIQRTYHSPTLFSDLFYSFCVTEVYFIFNLDNSEYSLKAKRSITETISLWL